MCARVNTEEHILSWREQSTHLVLDTEGRICNQNVSIGKPDEGALGQLGKNI